MKMVKEVKRKLIEIINKSIDVLNFCYEQGVASAKSSEGVNNLRYDAMISYFKQSSATIALIDAYLKIFGEECTNFRELRDRLENEVMGEETIIKECIRKALED